ncbi:hypothetical protein BELL_0059g00050 [Botrytis elliptica]|uniref:Uncharacterized protein n=1 Tax=Botrytis elliptica TaxID=278938 RepID=A0A4Z1JYD3_9HELO|nr:hypothetical protein BELL_0059g00050 [Botrytis elliptica]
MDIGSLHNPEEGGNIGAPSQASQESTTPMNSVPDQSNQWLDNTNSVVLKSAGDSDAFLESVGSMDKMKDIRKITRLWIKKVPGARLYSVRSGFWKEICDSWWFFLSEHSTEKLKLETWIEARIQKVFIILEKDRDLIR